MLFTISPRHSTPRKRFTEISICSSSLSFAHARTPPSSPPHAVKRRRQQKFAPRPASMASPRGPYSTHHLFKNHGLGPLNFLGNVNVASFTAVNPIYASFFLGYSVRQWTGFEVNAAQILAGKQSVTLSREQFTSVKAYFSDRSSNTEREAGVKRLHDARIFAACEALPYCDGYQWEPEVQLGQHRICDFALISDGDQRDQGQEGPEIVVEVKRPAVALQLGPDLTAEQLQDKLASPTLENDRPMFSFLQLFSYMLDSRKGLGVLSTFEYARFFRLDIGQRRVYISKAVRHDQTRRENRPHMVQAYLYLCSLEVRKTEFRRSEARRLLTGIRTRIGRKMEEERELEPAGSASRSRTANRGDDRVQARPSTRSRTRAWARIRAASASEIYLCADHLGSLGEGLCGEIMECLYEGVHLAVKMAYPHKVGRDKENKLEHVRNEIDMYAVLSELHGSSVPRVIAAEYGDESYVTCGGAMLITEKVGEATLRGDKDGLYAGKRLLRAEEVSEIQEKVIAGLDAIHKLDVLHMDLSFRNIRVSVGGGLRKVWWIDFGMSMESSEEETKCYEQHQLREMFRPFLL